MEKGDITNRRNAFRNNQDDKGIYWVNKRLGLIRNVIIFVGFAAFGIYVWYWFDNNGDKLKKPCQIAYEQEFYGEVVNVFLDKNSKGIVTVQLLQNNDTVEYYTGWGEHEKAGEKIRKGYFLRKRPNSFDLLVSKKQNAKAVIQLKAKQTTCE